MASPIFLRKKKLNLILANILWILFGGCLSLFLLFITVFIHTISNKKQTIEPEKEVILHCDKCNKEYKDYSFIIYSHEIRRYYLCIDCNEKFSQLRDEHREKLILDFIKN